MARRVCRAVCDWRGGVHWIARSESAREQLAVGRPGSGASGGDRCHSDANDDLESEDAVAGMEIGKCAGCR